MRLVQNVCVLCTKKDTNTKATGTSTSIKLGYPIQVMAMDLLGPLSESRARNSYVLVIADYFTRWLEVFALTNQEAKTVPKN